MKIIWAFTLLMIPGDVSSISVTGYSGREIIIACRYDREYTANAKYFCKGWWRPTCSDLIRTGEKDKWFNSGRFSLYDDTTAAVFTVTIRDLSELDYGTYRCGVDIHISEDFYTEVNLNVITGESSLITSASPITGSSLIIIVSVLLLLIITVILLVIVIPWRRRQSHNADSASKSSHVRNENSKAVSHTGCDYEEMKGTHKQLSTNPSSEPTGDSQILITSAEDLNYAELIPCLYWSI